MPTGMLDWSSTRMSLMVGDSRARVGATLLITSSGYYDGATILYECECRAFCCCSHVLLIESTDAWGDRFHFSRFRKGEGFTASVSPNTSSRVPSPLTLDPAARSTRTLPRQGNEHQARYARPRRWLRYRWPRP